MAGAGVLEFTDANFQTEVLDATEVVLVDLWAPWCGPCRMLAPTIDALATEYAGRAKVGKMNTDENPQIPSSLGVASIPTLLVYKGGQPVDRLVGAVPKERISAVLNKHLS